MQQAQKNIELSNLELTKINIKQRLASSYYNFQRIKEKERLYSQLDSLFNDFTAIANRRYEIGETNYLDKITAASKQQQIRLNYEEAKKNSENAYNQLKAIIQSNDSLTIARQPFLKVMVLPLEIENSTSINYYQKRIDLLQAERRLQKQQLLPDISFDYFQGSNSTLNTNLFGYQLGFKIPIFFWSQTAKNKVAQIAEEIGTKEFEVYQIQLTTKLNALKTEVTQLQKALEYYENEGAALSSEIIKIANKSYKNGEIDINQYIKSLESAFEIKLNHLDKLNAYNQAAIAINHLTL